MKAAALTRLNSRRRAGICCRKPGTCGRPCKPFAGVRSIAPSAPSGGPTDRSHGSARVRDPSCAGAGTGSSRSTISIRWTDIKNAERQNRVAELTGIRSAVRVHGAPGVHDLSDALGVCLASRPTVSGGLPSHAPGARSPLRDRASVPRVLGAAPWGQDCDGTEAWPTARGLWMCAACGHQASVIAGTIFQGTRTPLSVVPGDLVGGQPKKWRQRAGPNSACSAWAATARRGRGCTSCDARWCGLAGTGCRRRSRWTRPSWAGSRRAEAADTWGRRRWWSLRPRCGAGPSAASGCSGWPMPQPTAC